MACSFFLESIVNGNCDVRLERVRSGKSVREITEHDAVADWRSVGNVERNFYHESRIANQQTCIAVIGMIIIGAMTENQICIPFTNQPRDCFAVFQCRHDFSVVNI